MFAYNLCWFCMLCFNLEAIIVVLLSYCKHSVAYMLQFESLLKK